MEKERLLHEAARNQSVMQAQLSRARSDDVARLKSYKRSLEERKAIQAAAEEKVWEVRQSEEEKRVKGKKAAISAKLARLRARSRDLEAKGADLKLKEEELEKKTSQLASSVNEAEAAKETHAGVLASIKERESGLEAQAAAIAEQDARSKQIQSQLDSKAALIMEQEAQHREAQTELEARATQLLDQEAQQKAIQSDLHAKASELTERVAALDREKEELSSLREALAAQEAVLSKQAVVSKQQTEEHNALMAKLKERAESVHRREQALEGAVPPPVLSGASSETMGCCPDKIRCRCRLRKTKVVKYYNKSV
jgi:chromosome segregation ATPase